MRRGLAGMVLMLPLAVFAQESAETKVKTKDGVTVVADKSKPIRQEIEAWYQKNIAAFDAKDVEAIMALRTDDFHTLTPDGKTNTRADMEARTRSFVERIDHFTLQKFDIGTIDVTGHFASADIHQHTVRMQRFPDGTLHKVDSSVVQRETWKLTADGWKLYLVDQIRDGTLLVDDAPVPRP